MSEKSRQKQNHSELTIFKPVDKEKVKAQILEIRGLRVMLDKDIAEYFGVTTGNLNKAMKRNIQRFPESFCFQLTTNELLRFQFGISISILRFIRMIFILGYSLDSYSYI